MIPAAPILPARAERRAPRGIALLLVLGAVALGLTAATIAAQVAVTAGVTRRLDLALREADDVAASLAPRIERWLVAESQRAVVPVDSALPAIAIADERVDLGPGRSMRIRVTAFDQHGMVPWGEVVSGGPMAAYLPPGAAEAVREAPRGTADSPIPPGLDLLDGVGGSAVWPAHVAMRGSTGPRRFGREGPGDTDDGAGDEVGGSGPGAADRPALGSLVATHLTGGVRPSVNVNTAPRELVSLAESLTGRSVWTVVEEARAQGRPAAVGSLVPAASDAAAPAAPTTPSQAERTPTFVASSDLWSFRVDVAVGRARSSWWLTYARSDRGWLLRQRLRITG